MQEILTSWIALDDPYRYHRPVPLSMSRSALDELGKRLAKSNPRPTDAADLLNIATEYQALADQVKADLDGIGFPGAVTRVKSTGTLIDKLRRLQGYGLSKINDFAGARLLIRSVIIPKETMFAGGRRLSEDVSVAAGRYAQRWTFNRIIHEFKSRSAKDPLELDRCEEGMDSSGYRAMHVIVYPEGTPIEIQLRTPLQHAWAELSERLGDRWGRDFRYGGQPIGANELVVPGSTVTRGDAIAMLKATADIISRYEALCYQRDVKLLRTYTDGDAEARRHAEHEVTELNELQEAFQGMFRDILSGVRHRKWGLGMTYFLLAYDRYEGHLLRIDEYGDGREALAMRFEREREYADLDQYEVVVLAAQSLDALRRTHARYFRNAAALADRLMHEEQASHVKKAKRRDVRRARPAAA